MRWRTPVAVGGAIVAGFLVAITITGSWGALPGGASLLTVRVENVGTHDADVRIEVTKAGAGVAGIAEAPLKAGAAHEYAMPNDRSGDHSIKVVVRWESAFGERRGDRTTLADPADCSGSRTMLVTLPVDTTNGVSFGATSRDCVPR